ncbi:MAG: hypothetical protein KIS66_12020 [Fimbriimonadaceae bacterium]|nr:hypothetical protein [Fimbriimonadaceae bacterium]
MSGRIGHYALGVALACLLGLLVTPSSYWVVRLHVGVLTNEWRLTPLGPNRPIGGEPTRLWNRELVERSGAGPFVSQLVRATRAANPRERLAAIDAMEAAVQNDHDAARAVIVVRHRAAWTAQGQAPGRAEALVEACRRAILLDPGNAFVWLAMAYALVSSNAEDGDVCEVIRHAASLAEYSDYIVYEAETVTGAFLRARGYRGEFVEQSVLPDSLPSTSDAVFTSVAGWVAQRGLANSPIGDAAAETIRRAFVATRTGRELAPVASALRTLRDSLPVLPGDSSYVKHEKERRVAGYNAYLAEIDGTLNQLRDRLNLPRLNRQDLSMGIVARSSVLGLVIVSALAGGLLVLTKRRRTGRDWTPFAAAGAGFFLASWVAANMVVPLVPAALSVLLSLPGLKGTPRWAVSAIALSSAIWAVGAVPVSLAPTLVLVLALVANALPSARCSPAIAMPLVSILVVGTWVLNESAAAPPEIRSAFAVLFVPALLGLTANSRRERTHMAIGLTMAFASVSYLWAVTVEIRTNEVLRATEAGWRYEIERAKSESVIETVSPS